MTPSSAGHWPGSLPAGTRPPKDLRLLRHRDHRATGRNPQPKERRQEIKAILAKVKAGRPVGQFESLRVRKDGTVFPASLTISPIRDGNGAIVGASTSARDVSERTKADQDIQRLATAIEFSRDAIITSAPDTLITSWNPAVERLFGYPREQMIGRSGKLLSHVDRALEIQEIMTKLAAGQAVENLATERVRSDGTAFPVSLTVSPVCDADGAVVGAVSITRDESRRVQAEQAVAQASQKYRMLAEHASDLVVLASVREVERLGWPSERCRSTAALHHQRPTARHLCAVAPSRQP